MNEYFCSTGEKLAADIDHTSNLLVSKEISINGGGRIYDFREINERDIHEAMFRIKVKKSFVSFSFRGTKCWNGLSTEAKETTSVKAFKCLL